MTFYYWQRREETSAEVIAEGFQQLQLVADHELIVCLPEGEVVLRAACISTLAQVALDQETACAAASSARGAGGKIGNRPLH